jgi:hypothetical protein
MLKNKRGKLMLPFSTPGEEKTHIPPLNTPKTGQNPTPQNF